MAFSLPQQFSAPGSISSHLSASRHSQRLFTQELFQVVGNALRFSKLFWQFLAEEEVAHIFLQFQDLVCTSKSVNRAPFFFYISVKLVHYTSAATFLLTLFSKCFSPAGKSLPLNTPVLILLSYKYSSLGVIEMVLPIQKGF